MGILDTQATPNTIIVQEAISSTEFMILEIRESIRDRSVSAEVHYGPFTTQTRPDGSTWQQGILRRQVTIWENEAYDAVRDTWRNEDLIAKIGELMANTTFI